MDEVRMVRDGYAEPAPPTAQAIAHAKALLNDPPRRALPRRLPRRRWGLGGVVAAGVAAAVAIALAGGNTLDGKNAAAPPHSVRLDQKGAFLAAVRKAEQQPIGAYWYVDEVSGQSYIMRPKTGTYAITGAHTEAFRWWGARSSTGEAMYERGIPARPLTARDASLWRRAGSPSRFPVWSSDHHYTYTTKATKWQVDILNRHGGGEFLGGRSVEDLQKLPTDPAKLAAMFLSQTELRRAALGAPPDRQPSPEVARLMKKMRVEPRAKLARVGRLLGMAPIPPKVRAGLMRALAAQQGIHAIGHDTDPLGRQGVALAADDSPVTATGEYGAPKAEQGTYRSRPVIIFDEHTGALLSTQEELTKPGGRYAAMKPGFVINYFADRAAKWTDTKPVPPAALPFG